MSNRATPDRMNKSEAVDEKKIYSSASDTGWPGGAMDAVQKALAAYRGHDIWREVISCLDGYDDDATATLSGVSARQVFVADGTAYHWTPENVVWQASDAEVEIAELMSDPRSMLITFVRRRMPRRWKRPLR